MELLTNTQVSKLCKTFANGSSANIKLSEPPLHKIRQSRGFLERHLGPLLKLRWPLTQNVLKSLTKSVLVLFKLTAASLATNAAIHKKVFGSGTTALVIFNKK